MLRLGRSLSDDERLWSIEHAYTLVCITVRRDATRCDAFDRLESERASHSARIALFSRLPENREKRNRMCVHICTSLPSTSREKTMRNGSVLPVVVQPRDIQQNFYLRLISKGEERLARRPEMKLI